LTKTELIYSVSYFNLGGGQAHQSVPVATVSAKPKKLKVCHYSENED